MTETITSTHNPRIRALRKLRDRKHREEQRLFMAEGEDMLAAAIGAGAEPRTVFAVPDPAQPLEALLAGLPARTELVTATPHALEAAGSLGSGSRVIGVWEQQWSFLDEPARRLADDRPSVYLHDVADPGNVGTVLRAASAFGADPVVLSPRTADPFGPKAVRASMGAVFGRPPARSGFDAARAALAGHHAVALVPGTGRPLRELPLGGPVLFVLGAERAGLPPEVVAACDEVAHVPLDREAAESLNVAMTATLCLYEYRASHA